MAAAIQRLLVPVDLSSCSRAALEFACNLARPLGAKLEVLFVRQPEAGAPSVEAARDELHRFVAPLVAGLGEPVSERVDSGDARERILAAAEASNADAIVLGTHGRTGRARSLAGSVAESVVRSASCPVITVRER